MQFRNQLHRKHSWLAGSSLYKEIVERENKIAKEQSAVTELVSKLINSLNLAISEKRFNDALRFCSELIEVDFANSRKWSVKIADIKNQQEKTEENEKRWRNLLHDIDTAHLSEDWEKLVSLCKEALGIQEDSFIRTKLKKAEEKLNEIQSIKLVDEMIVEIKDLILDADFETAKSKLSAIRKMNLNSVTETKVKELNALIFQKEDEAEIAKGGKKKQPHDNNESASVGGRNVVKGFSKGEKKSSIDDDFFSSPSPSHKVNNKPKKEVAKQGKSIPQKNDDFFDNNSEKATKGKNKSKQHGVITNDDFDF